MKLSCLSCILLCLFLYSCKSKVAYNYSQKIVSMERSLIPTMTTTEQDVAKYAKVQNWDSVNNISDRMEKLVNSKLEEIKMETAPDVKEGEEFKKASIRYFEYISDIYASYKDVAVQ